MRGCFEKWFSKAELAKNPGQVVTVMQLQTGFALDADAGEGEQDSLVVRFVGDPKEYYLEPLCSGNKEEASCDVSGSNGGFNVLKTDKGAQVRFKSLIRLKANAEGYPEKDIPLDKANTVYELARVSKDSCSSLEGRKK
jgi:hypothetical protein